MPVTHVTCASEDLLLLCSKYGEKGLPPNSINIRMTGSGGQSFCAFLARGVSVELEGDANDYVCKVRCDAEVHRRVHVYTCSTCTMITMHTHMHAMYDCVVPRACRAARWSSTRPSRCRPASTPSTTSSSVTSSSTAPRRARPSSVVRPPSGSVCEIPALQLSAR